MFRGRSIQRPCSGTNTGPTLGLLIEQLPTFCWPAFVYLTGELSAAVKNHHSSGAPEDARRVCRMLFEILSEKTAGRLLLSTIITIYCRCTPRKRRGLPLFVGVLLLMFTAAWAFMAGAYPLYIAGTQDPNSPLSHNSNSIPDLVPHALTRWFSFSATGNWESLSDQYLLQWGALSAATVSAGQPYR